MLHFFVGHPGNACGDNIRNTVSWGSVSTVFSRESCPKSRVSVSAYHRIFHISELHATGSRMAPWIEWQPWETWLLFFICWRTFNVVRFQMCCISEFSRPFLSKYIFSITELSIRWQTWEWLQVVPSWGEIMHWCCRGIWIPACKPPWTSTDSNKLICYEVAP